jgi:hypothetical protein
MGADVLVHFLNVALSFFNSFKNLFRTLFLKHLLGLRSVQTRRITKTVARKEIVNGLHFGNLSLFHGLATINNFFLKSFESLTQVSNSRVFFDNFVVLLLVLSIVPSNFTLLTLRLSKLVFQD